VYRLFVSLELPESVKAELARICGDVPGARWLEPDEIHLTLRFIGEVDGVVYSDVLDALAQVRAPAFSLTLKGVGYFPPRGEAHTLWTGVERNESLFALRDKIESALVRAGIEPERRKFAPHVTIARLKRAPMRAVGSFIAQHGLFRAPAFAVEEFCLYSSRLSAKRALHRCEATYDLEGAAVTA
jgi:2'-5' RNA ligase